MKNYWSFIKVQMCICIKFKQIWLSVNGVNSVRALLTQYIVIRVRLVQWNNDFEHITLANLWVTSGIESAVLKQIPYAGAESVCPAIISKKCGYIGFFEVGSGFSSVMWSYFTVRFAFE